MMSDETRHNDPLRDDMMGGFPPAPAPAPVPPFPPHPAHMAGKEELAQMEERRRFQDNLKQEISAEVSKALMGAMTQGADTVSKNTKVVMVSTVGSIIAIILFFIGITWKAGGIRTDILLGMSKLSSSVEALYKSVADGAEDRKNIKFSLEKGLERLDGRVNSLQADVNDIRVDVTTLKKQDQRP